jgi:hypothetical protein
LTTSTPGFTTTAPLPALTRIANRPTILPVSTRW